MTLRFRFLSFILTATLVCQGTSALAGSADVIGAKCHLEADGTFRFDVTVAHNDTGWDHFADIWQVLGSDQVVLGERILAHPHETEQPFTRSQSGIEISPDINEVTIRAHDKIHGWGGKEIVVDRRDCTGE